MPRRKNADGFLAKRAHPSAEALDNQTRNELQKTLLLLAHRRILREERATLLDQYREILDKLGYRWPI